MPDWRRAALRRFAGCAVLAVVGIVLLIAGEQANAVWLAGSALLGLAGVLAVAFVFLEVGYSEDRARGER
jgi:uncharacterized membrane protein